MDPPFGLKVAPWDEAALSPTEFQAILKSVCFVNGQNDFHILCFCEFSMYGEYVKAAQAEFGDKIAHVGPIFLAYKDKFMPGRDLANSVTTAVLIRLGNAVFNNTVVPKWWNFFLTKLPEFIKNEDNKPYNPCQKPHKFISTLIQLFTTPTDTVLDLFAGTGTVARCCVALGRNSLSVEIDETQTNLLKNFLRSESLGEKAEVSTETCAQCANVFTADDPAVSCPNCAKKIHEGCGVKVPGGEKVYCSDLCAEFNL